MAFLPAGDGANQNYLDTEMARLLKLPAASCSPAKAGFEM
jgi:hypothetical protein